MLLCSGLQNLKININEDFQKRYYVTLQLMGLQNCLCYNFEDDLMEYSSESGCFTEIELLLQMFCFLKDLGYAWITNSNAFNPSRVQKIVPPCFFIPAPDPLCAVFRAACVTLCSNKVLCFQDFPSDFFHLMPCPSAWTKYFLSWTKSDLF